MVRESPIGERRISLLWTKNAPNEDNQKVMCRQILRAPYINVFKGYLQVGHKTGSSSELHKKRCYLFDIRKPMSPRRF